MSEKNKCQKCLIQDANPKYGTLCTACYREEVFKRPPGKADGLEQNIIKTKK